MMAVFERIADERLRQQCLLAEGRFKYNTAQPTTGPFKKLAILVEEVGEVANAIDCLENGDKATDLEIRQARMSHLREELVQVAAVAVAWLESMEVVP